MLKSRLFAAPRPNLTESNVAANISEQSPSTARSGKFFLQKKSFFYRRFGTWLRRGRSSLLHLQVITPSHSLFQNYLSATLFVVHSIIRLFMPQPHSKPKPSSWTPAPWPRAPRPHPAAPPIAPSQRQLFISTPPPAHQGSLSPFTGEDALDPLMQLQQNLAALNQATKNSLKRKHWTTCVPGEPGH